MKKLHVKLTFTEPVLGTWPSNQNIAREFIASKSPDAASIEDEVAALGADAVLIARPFVTMVYGGAEEGVAAYVDKLKAELADTMAMCGAHTLADINRSMLFGF